MSIDKQHPSQLTFLSVGSPARTYQWPEDARALMESAPGSGFNLLELLQNLARDGYLLKMSPVFYLATKGETLGSFSEGWSTGGIAWPGGYLTVNTSEFPNDAGACSLWDILETDVPPKYYLSRKACRGILRRAALRETELPEPLMKSLQAVAGDHKEMSETS